MPTRSIIRVGTRGSRLALVQARWVIEKLSRRFPEHQFRIVTVKTSGDLLQDKPFHLMDGKAFFIKELEESLLQGEIDLAVHSMKDVPTVLLSGMQIAAVTERIEPRDAWISYRVPFGELSPGAVVGTGSLRRTAQLKHLCAGVEVVPLRGNVDTRLNKLEKEGLTGIILAGAGLVRLGLQERISELLPPEKMLPAVGQGALCLETRIEDQKALRISAALDHRPSRAAVMAERGFLEKLGAGCQVPVGAMGLCQGERLTLTAAVGDLDGKKLLRDSLTREGVFPAEEEEWREMGRELARKLLHAGGKDILEHYRPS